jgi:hypothetical protein
MIADTVTLDARLFAKYGTEYRYLLTMTEHFSKYSMAFPLKTHTMAETCGVPAQVGGGGPPVNSGGPPPVVQKHIDSPSGGDPPLAEGSYIQKKIIFWNP